jgi:hypothetical protein
VRVCVRVLGIENVELYRQGLFLRCVEERQSDNFVVRGHVSRFLYRIGIATQSSLIIAKRVNYNL